MLIRITDLMRNRKKLRLLASGPISALNCAILQANDETSNRLNEMTSVF